MKKIKISFVILNEQLIYGYIFETIGEYGFNN